MAKHLALEEHLSIEKTAPVRYLMEPIALGEPHEVAPGILWLRLPLPFALDHVNVWLLDDGDGWTLIDTGVQDKRTQAIWEQLLESRFRQKPIRRVIATHFHPDHIGLCGWLVERLDATFHTSRVEWLQARLLALDTTDDFARVGRAYDRAAGLADDLAEQRFSNGNRYRLIAGPPPASFARLAAGDEIAMGGTRWRVLVGEGHSPEMLTFFSAERNILIAADHVLPRISPVIAVWPPSPDADPLGDFLRTLPPYLDLPEDALVLPSHDAPFQGLHDRVTTLIGHHDERCTLTLRAAAEPATLVEIMGRLFRRRFDAHQLGFALGETMAHVNFLLVKGRLERAGERDGAKLYRGVRAADL